MKVVDRGALSHMRACILELRARARDAVSDLSAQDSSVRSLTFGDGALSRVRLGVR